MAATAIQKAIEQLSEYRDTYNSMCDEFTLIDNCVDKLTELLPYERETIEAAYEIGGINSEAMAVNGFSKYNNEQDYFTKTYQND